MSELMIFGCGYSGTAYARAYRAQFTRCIGTTRSVDRMADLHDAGVEPLLFDGASRSHAVVEALHRAEDLLISIAPDASGDPVLNQFADDILNHPPRWIGYLSTVGVYGDHQGAWVDESTPTRPVSTRSVQRVNAETNWVKLCSKAGIPVTVLRLAGIYGPGRNAFVNLTQGTAKRLIKPGQVFNRIHVRDIAQSIEAARVAKYDGMINVTDDEPAPPHDVVSFAARLMGIEPPPEQDFTTATLSPMARSFYGENKRVSNKLLRETLGVSLSYPTYRQAHEAMWREGWR